MNSLSSKYEGVLGLKSRLIWSQRNETHYVRNNGCWYKTIVLIEKNVESFPLHLTRYNLLQCNKIKIQCPSQNYTCYNDCYEHEFIFREMNEQLKSFFSTTIFECQTVNNYQWKAIYSMVMDFTSPSIISKKKEENKQTEQNPPQEEHCKVF